MLRQSALALEGPLGVRRFYSPQRCQPHMGHFHNYAHKTRCTDGRLLVKGARSLYWLRRLLGLALYEDIALLTAGGWVEIKARRRHMIVCAEDGTRYQCEYQHRDFNGLVIDHYIGNNDAYGNDRLDEAMPDVRVALA